MPETQVEIGQEVFILLVAGGMFPHRKVGKATVEKIEDDGTLWVSTPKGVNCPWKKSLDEVFLTKSEASKALKAWLDSLPSIQEIFSRPSLGKAPDVRQ